MSSSTVSPSSSNGQPVLMPAPRELDLFAFGILFLRNLKFILGCGLVAALGMLAYVLHVKPRYASTAVMVIPQGNVTASAMREQLSLVTADLLGGGFELYSDILSSRTVAERVIADNGLQKHYGQPDLENAVLVLTSLTKVETGREGMIRVTVQDTDPRVAADVANDYLRQLDRMNSQLVLTSVGQQRAYLERELVNEKNSLADAEVALKEVTEKSSGLPPEAQATAGLTALETTRAQLRADQVRLAALLTGETEANPEVVRLRQEIAGLTGQVESLQRGADSAINGTPTNRMPEQTLEYTRRLRDVKFHETLFDLLEKQYETAKQEEARSPSIVQVLDPAVPSRHKAWPPRLYFLLMATVAGFLLGLVLVAARALLSSYVNNPANADKLRQVRRLLHLPVRA